MQHAKRRSIRMRAILALGTWRTVGGFPVGTSADADTADLAFARSVEALSLIGRHSPRRFARLSKHFSQFWSMPLDGAFARHDPAFRMCILDLPYLTRASSTGAETAGLIVHE